MTPAGRGEVCHPTAVMPTKQPNPHSPTAVQSGTMPGQGNERERGGEREGEEGDGRTDRQT